MTAGQAIYEWDFTGVDMLEAERGALPDQLEQPHKFRTQMRPQPDEG